MDKTYRQAPQAQGPGAGAGDTGKQLQSYSAFANRLALPPAAVVSTQTCFSMMA